MRTTPRLGLTVWDSVNDPFDHVELAANWDAIDAQAFIAKGVELVTSLPTTNNFPGRVVMLSASSDGFPAWTLMRYDGSNWAPVGSVEIHSQLPPNPYDGRMIILSSSDGGFPAWTLLRYNGNNWSPIMEIGIAKDGNIISSRSNINLIEGGGIDLSVSDDSTNEEVDITVNTSVDSVLIKKNGVAIGERNILNLVEGTNTTLTMSSESQEVNVKPNFTSLAPVPQATILDTTVYTSSSSVSLGSASTTNWTDFNNALAVDFTVPSSGRVMITFSATIEAAYGSRTSSGYPKWGVTEDGSIVANSIVGLTVDYLTRRHLAVRRIVTGLTPSQSKTWKWAGSAVTINPYLSPAIFTVWKID